MVKIQQHVSLQPYNTFGIKTYAKSFVEVNDISALKEILALDGEKFFLGGGSNILLTGNVDALVVHLNIKGVELVEETDRSVIVKVMAGENWHEFVQWSLQHDFGGLENLSLIPGNVGTAPMQNIGAYGVELKDVFVQCETIEVVTGEKRTFTLDDCKFGYRSSIFKTEEKGNYVITAVHFKLTKSPFHKINTSYGAIERELETQGIGTPSIQHVSKAVIAIRERKLPNPKILGNSGSFFKNPVISKAQFKDLQLAYPAVPHYTLNDQEIKVPAGWLIEQAGFKGMRFGDAGVHTQQALVLVNHGHAKGEEIWKLAQQIQRKVLQCFHIHIEPEVNIIGS